MHNRYFKLNKSIAEFLTSATAPAMRRSSRSLPPSRISKQEVHCDRKEGKTVLFMLDLSKIEKKKSAASKEEPVVEVLGVLGPPWHKHCPPSPRSCCFRKRAPLATGLLKPKP